MTMSLLRVGGRSFSLALTSMLALGLLATSPAAAQLSIAIEANPGVALPGEQLEIRVTVSNPGGSDVAGVILSLPIPAEVNTFLTAVATPVAGGCTQITNNAACQSGETLIWSLGTIAAGQSITASLSPTVAAGAIGPIAFDPVLNSGSTASASIAVNAALALDVSLHEAADPIAAGDALAYTLHFGNRSASNAAPNALLRLPLPANTTFVSASDGGVLNGGAVEWSLGTLAPGQSGTRDVVLASGAGLARGALVLASAELSDTTPQVARARALTEIDGLEALVLEMVVGPDPAAPGEQLDVELTVSNPTAFDLATVTLLLRWPHEIDPLLISQGTFGPIGCTQIANNTACTAGEASVWSLGTLTAGQSITVSYSADLAATVAEGSIAEFRATAQSSTFDDRAEVARAVAVDVANGLDVSLHEDRDPIAAGDALAYTLHFGNRSTTTAAPNALLRLPLPANTTFVSASSGGVLNGSAVEWSLGTLAPGQSGTRRVVLDSDLGLVDGTLLAARATLSDTSSPPQLARAGASTEIDGLDPLELTMVVGPDSAAPGEQLELELTVSNPTAVDLAAVTLLLVWPHEIDPLLTAQGTFAPVGCTQIANNAACTAGEASIWSLGTLSAGQSVTVTYSADLAPTTVDGSIVEFRATATSTTVDDQARVGRAIAVDASNGLDVSLHEVRDPIAAGDELAYTLHFGNRSTTTAAPNALLRLPLPADTTFVSASDGGVLNGSAVEWSLGTLAPGQSGTRSVVLASGAGLIDGTLIDAVATLSDTSAPSQLARAGASTEIDDLEPLELALAVGPDPAAPGEPLAIELTVSNRSALDLATVTLQLRWPHEIDPLFTAQGTSGPIGCTQILNNAGCSAGEVAVWSLGTLNAGQSVTVAYSADLVAGLVDGQTVDFRATASSPSADQQARVGRALAVDATSALEVAVHEVADPVTAGDVLVYTLSFANTSRTSAAPNVELRWPLPAGTTFVGASDSGVLNGGTVEWSLGTLPAGRTGTRSVTVQTDGGLLRGSLLRSEAAIFDAALPPQLARASSIAEIDGLEALEAAIDLTLDQTDWAWKVDVTVTNNDVVSHTGVTLTLRVPRDALTFAFGSVTGGGVSGCTQIFNNAFCEVGELVAWNLGTLTAGQSVTVSVPNLYIAHPTADLGELFSLDAIALGAGVDDRAVDHVVPEPGTAASLLAGMGVLVGLARSRVRSGIGQKPCRKPCQKRCPER
ncbi:MAG: DUF11 domain-containing protein [Deltaproteobacteria bacterium]|nr:DUF11 domain-containing protein [Deltaproteobacteria bacterium]